MSGRLLVVCLLATGCEWIDDAEMTARFDADGDGIPLGSDCNDDDAEIGLLDAQLELECGAVIEAEIAGADHLGVSPCLHPLKPDTLLNYGRREDIRSLRSEVPVEATVTLTTHPGFRLRAPFRLTSDTGFEEGGAALFGWRGWECDEEACTIGLPLGTGSQMAGSGGWVSSFTGQVEPGEAWYVVVTGDGESPYTLTVDCR